MDQITSIDDFPVLESTQFQFMSASPTISIMISMTNNKEYQKRIQTTKPENWTRNMFMARMLHNNPKYSPVIDQKAIDKYGHEKAINAFRYLSQFIKQVRIRPVDRVAIINWFLDQGILDIEQTASFNKIELPDEKEH